MRPIDQGRVHMVFMLVLLLSVLAIYSAGYWSTRIFPSARPFRYNQSPDVHIAEARQTMLHSTFATRFDLHDLTQTCLTDADRIEKIIKWTHALWLPQAGRHSKSDNPIVIASRAKKGERFSRSEYAIIAAHAMQAIGIPTRLTNLRTRDCVWRPLSSSYLGIEYFDRDHFKWVWLDAQFGVRVLQNHTPLNVLELKDSLLNNKLVELHPDFHEFDIEQYMQKLEPYLDIVVACPIGQSKNYALIPPQLNLLKHKWLVGKTIYDITCRSVISFYASHPIKQLTQPTKTQPVDIRTGRPVSL
jgi:hypothetical protein